MPRGRPSDHILTDVDREARTATCSFCGPVSIYLSGKYATCSERAKRAQRSWRAENSDLVLRERRQRKYNISARRYNAMLTAQNGRCAICGAEPDGFDLVVDHDHACCSGVKACGKCVRGLLCRACNTALGSFRDSVQILNAATLYLYANGAITENGYAA